MLDIKIQHHGANITISVPKHKPKPNNLDSLIKKQKNKLVIPNGHGAIVISASYILKEPTSIYISKQNGQQF